MNLAPIILFTYKRLDTLKQTVETLQRNYLAKDSELIIYSDGAKDARGKEAVEAVREYLKTIVGFKSVVLHLSDCNKGLAESIISGISEVMIKHERVIVLEDDLVSSPNFLNYMNDALIYYKKEQQVFSIAGFSIPVIKKINVDVYFTYRASSWGWATWRDRWNNIDWEVKDYEIFKKDSKQRRAFNRMGSDMSGMLDKQMNGKINSWAIRWCYHQFKHSLFSVHPFLSKIDNIGFNSDDASNTKEKYNRYETKLDQEHKRLFNFPTDLKLDKDIIEQFTKPFSIATRIKYKMLHLISKL